MKAQPAMQILVEWDNPEKTAIRFIFPAVWERADFARARDAGHALATSVEQPVDVILDMQASQVLPDGIMICGQRMLQMAPANYNRFVVLGGGKQVKMVVHLFCEIHPGASDHVCFVDEEAALYRLLGRPVVPSGITV